LPVGWPNAVFAGLEGLESLRKGSLTVDSRKISIRGIGKSQDSGQRIRDRLEKISDYWEIGDIEVVFGDSSELEHFAHDLPKLTPMQCEERMSDRMATQQISFEPGESTIEPASSDVIDAVGNLLVRCPEAHFEVQGHTDSIGDAEMNRRLSLERAESVVTALVEHEVAESRLSARGYGEDQPVADNSTELGRKKNRRITFLLLSNANSSDVSNPSE